MCVCLRMCAWILVCACAHVYECACMCCRHACLCVCVFLWSCICICVEVGMYYFGNSFIKTHCSLALCCQKISFPNSFLILLTLMSMSLAIPQSRSWIWMRYSIRHLYDTYIGTSILILSSNILLFVLLFNCFFYR